MKISDPVIKTLFNDLSGMGSYTVYDAKDTLNVVPYKSVASKLLSQKLETDAYLNSCTDPDMEKRKADLQNALHELELQRVELQRQLDQDKVAHNEGNVWLRELAAKKGELADKINTIHNELELFDSHLKDLSVKNKKLTSTLREIQMEEDNCERELAELDKEKMELAQRLAEVTQNHAAKQKYIAQLCARRSSCVESLNKMHQDAGEYQKQVTDLDSKRRQMNEEFCQLADEENDTDRKLREIDQNRRKRFQEIGDVTDKIGEVQRNVLDAVPAPPPPPAVHQVLTVPLDHVPVADRSAKAEPLVIPPHSHLPDGYESGPRVAFGPIASNAVVGGKIPPTQTKGVPVFQLRPLQEHSEYYSPALRAALKVNGTIAPATGHPVPGPHPTGPALEACRDCGRALPPGVSASLADAHASHAGEAKPPTPPSAGRGGGGVTLPQLPVGGRNGAAAPGAKPGGAVGAHLAPNPGFQTNYGRSFNK